MFDLDTLLYKMLRSFNDLHCVGSFTAMKAGQNWEKKFDFVDQAVHQCLDTLHRHFTRYTDRPYGRMLPNNTNRISSPFY